MSAFISRIVLSTNDWCSDGVLNPSGVRFGSAEIYTALEAFTGVVEDSLCVGQRRKEDNDERVLLFVKMRPGNAFTKELVKDIKQTIRQKMSPRHVPSFVFEVEDIPVSASSIPPFVLDNV